MRLAVLTDLHANPYALRAVLAEARSLGADQFFHTGDAIDLGPSPAATLDLLLENEVTCIMGNHDAAAVLGIPDGVHGEHRRHFEWTHAQLTDAHRRAIAGFFWRLDLAGDGMHCRFQHFALPRPGHRPSSDPFLPPPAPLSAEGFDALFLDDSAPKPALCFHGHTHRPTDLTGTTRHLNPGPTGLSGEGHGMAPYYLLTMERRRVDLELRYALYDTEPLRRDFFRTEIPDRDSILQLFHAGL
jgi:predicted phosphodiesterase